MAGRELVGVLGADEDLVLDDTHAVDLRLEPDLGTRRRRRLGQRLDDLAEPTSGVEVGMPLPVAAVATHDPRGDLPGRVGRYAPPGLNAADAVAGKSPQLLGEGPVQLVVEGRPEARAQHSGVGVRTRSTQRRGGRLAGDPGDQGYG